MARQADPAKKAEAYRLRDRAGLKTAEIADRTGIPVGTLGYWFSPSGRRANGRPADPLADRRRPKAAPKPPKKKPGRGTKPRVGRTSNVAEKAAPKKRRKRESSDPPPHVPHSPLPPETAEQRRRRADALRSTEIGMRLDARIREIEEESFERFHEERDA